MNLPRLKSLFGGVPSDWNVPGWNLPSAQEFLSVRENIAALHGELLLLEKKIEEKERALVIEECGESCEPTKARLAKAYFVSPDWQTLWNKFQDATRDAEQLKTQWDNEVPKVKK